LRGWVSLLISARQEAELSEFKPDIIAIKPNRVFAQRMQGAQRIGTLRMRPVRSCTET
jgi:hypothetical protein